jgi:hypothetical protein
MGHIYMLKNKKNGKIYIGQTTRPIEKRFEEHQRKDSNCVAIYNAIQKHGWENFEKDHYECPNEDLNFDEELLIKEMETLAPNGKLLGSYESVGEAARHLEKKSQSSISACARNAPGYNSAHGFKWSYNHL